VQKKSARRLSSAGRFRWFCWDWPRRTLRFKWPVSNSLGVRGS